MNSNFSKEQCNSYLNKKISEKIKYARNNCPQFDEDSVLKYINYFYTSNAKDRLKKALINQYDKVSSDFASSVLETSSFEIFAENELNATHNYHFTDYHGALRLGATIWILEEIAKNDNPKHENLKKLKNLKLPLFVPNKQLPNYGHLFKTKHMCFPNKIIRSVFYAINNRYSSDFLHVDYQLKNPCVKTVEQLNDKKLNENYQALLNLIPQASIDEACNLLKTTVWDLSRLIFDFQCYYASIVRENSINVLSENHNHEKSVATDYLDGISVNIFDYIFSNSKKVDELWASPELIKRVLNFKTLNPFALCFALFYLSDIDDDIVWFLGSTGQLMLVVYKLLPWFDDKCFLKTPFLKIFDDIENNKKKRIIQSKQFAPIYHYYYSKVGNLNFAQILYRNSDTIIPYLFPFNGYMEFPSKKIPDTLRFTLATASGFLNYPNYSSFFMLKNRFNDKEQMKPSVDLKDKLDKLRTDNKRLIEDSSKLRKINLENKTKIVNLNKNVDKLKQSNLKLEHEYNKLKSKFDNLQSAFDREHSELVDLRNFYVNVSNNENVEDITEDKLPNFPYCLNKRIAVFGGKESFKAIMKQRFPDANFYDNNIIRGDYIKNSDIVFINTYFINHPKLESICNYASSYNVPIRYFTTSGINNCCKQIIDADKN